MVIFHGSNIIVDKPSYGVGRPDNDYGSGFYCTEDIELAGEWAATGITHFLPDIENADVI